jgi:hypothetical protein
MTFIVHFKDGSRRIYPTIYNEDLKEERDAAWDEINALFPEADYIEEF